MQNTAPIHFDVNYAQDTEFKRPLVNSCFTIALVTGQTVSDVLQNVFANLEWEQVRMPHPLFEGTRSTAKAKCSPSEIRNRGPTSAF
jgi:itaconyl-CoA hydratase